MIQKNPNLDQRSNELVNQHLNVIQSRTDRMFAVLLGLQWVGGIIAAITLSPETWAGTASSVHGHVWAAVFLGGIIAAVPIYLAVRLPGHVVTRHLVAIGQMLFSALLIHLTGGRIETHFHVFGSLAFLAAYRDWRVLLTATLVVAVDHGVRGAVWPESVFGVSSAAPWRTIEHAAWVVFENVFLIITIRQSLSEMRKVGQHQAMLEDTNRLTESIVQTRTAELLRTEQRLQLIIDSVPNGVIMIDRHSNIEFANPNAERMFGFETGELAGRQIDSIIPDANRYLNVNASDETIRNPDVRQLGNGGSTRALRNDGVEFPIELGMNPLQTDEGLFVLASVVDISSRKKAELELQRYARRMQSKNQDLRKMQVELEIKNQELDEFTYVASHDLQEPVRKLVSFSSLLRQDLGHDINEQAERDLGFIVDAATRMRKLIQDLLALSRAGREAMKITDLPLRECVDRSVQTLEMLVEERAATLEIADDLPTVRGDATLLTQLYQNLIGNALKFVREEAPRIALTAEDAGDHWILGVRDNGIGMKSEYAERIFKPFQRLHSRDQYEGTGIGLSICKKTVQRHGGKIWVESQPDEGSHFKFTLPKHVESDSCQESKPAKNQLLSC